MTATEFYKAFLEETAEGRIWEDGRTLLEIYRTDADYTKVVMKIINQIIDREYTHQNEYFRIDAVGWTSNYQDIQEEAKELHLSAHLWNLKIAVEHENSKSDWTDEVIKLVHIKCPVKVIISYNYSDERDEPEQKRLSAAARWMQKIDAFQKGTDEEYMIILGNGCNHKTDISDYSRFDYRAYLYSRSSGSFEPVKA